MLSMFRTTTVSAPRAAVARAFSTTSVALRDVAKITLIGRLAADPEVVQTSTGREIVKYAVGARYGLGENAKTSWYKVVAFDPNSKPYLLSLTKGALVYVEGDISTSYYETEDGKKNLSLNIVHRTISTLGPRRHEGSEEGGDHE
ncbi:ssDNA-binding protein, mitochondrial [Rhizina undulata]